ncbi:MAG: GDP-L-fucose synthase [Sphingopyxis sp.]|nr:GDP-L-fucose synthase [Sphingopyxis sp.]
MTHFGLAKRRIFVAGHRGMVGGAIVRRLERENCEVLTATRAEVDLLDQAAVTVFLENTRPDAVVIAAAKVGGILVNDSFPADFLYENLMIAANLVHASHRADVDRLLFLGSSCIYPKWADQPIQEDALLTGPLEPTNEWYAIAKIAGIKLCQSYRRQYGRDYISAMPTNLYGPGDNFDLNSSHVLPALMRKAHEAKLANSEKMILWGSGTPRREFLYADDCADACVFLLEHYADEMHINVGSGTDVTIVELAETIRDVVGFEGGLEFDTSRPDGTMRKLMDNQRLLGLGWSPSVSLDSGIRQTYDWFLKHGSA